MKRAPIQGNESSCREEQAHAGTGVAEKSATRCRREGKPGRPVTGQRPTSSADYVASWKQYPPKSAYESNRLSLVSLPDIQRNALFSLYLSLSFSLVSFFCRLCVCVTLWESFGSVLTRDSRLISLILSLLTLMN